MTSCKNLNNVCGGFCWIEGADEGLKGHFREDTITDDEQTAMLFINEALERKCKYAPYFFDEYVDRVMEVALR